MDVLEHHNANVLREYTAAFLNDPRTWPPPLKNMCRVAVLLHRDSLLGSVVDTPDDILHYIGTFLSGNAFGVNWKKGRKQTPSP